MIVGWVEDDNCFVSKWAEMILILISKNQIVADRQVWFVSRCTELIGTIRWSKKNIGNNQGDTVDLKHENNR